MSSMARHPKKKATIRGLTNVPGNFGPVLSAGRRHGPELGPQGSGTHGCLTCRPSPVARSQSQCWSDGTPGWHLGGGTVHKKVVRNKDFGLGFERANLDAMDLFPNGVCNAAHILIKNMKLC
jgi:ribosomal protein L37AE/L43A